MKRLDLPQLLASIAVLLCVALCFAHFFVVHSTWLWYTQIALCSASLILYTVSLIHFIINRRPCMPYSLPVELDLTSRSEEFQEFYEAFAFETYGKSMGRAAEQCETFHFKNFNEEEKALATEWFLYLFAQQRPYYGKSYFAVAEQMNDARFIPLIRLCRKQWKRKNGKFRKTLISGKTYLISRDFSTEIGWCDHTIAALQQA